MVAVQARRSDGVSGNAEMPGVAESINCINSVCRLDSRQVVSAKTYSSRMACRGR